MNSFCEEDIIALQRWQKGSKKAFEPIVRKYMKKAYFIALGFVGNRDDALELSQEAFFRAYRKRNTFRSASDFFPWFYQILRNICFDHLRKVKRKRLHFPQSLDDPDTSPLVSDCFDPEAVAQRNETRDNLWKAIGQLDEKHREVIMLRHFQNFSYEQIAQTLFCSKGTVMSRLYYARKKLKEILDNRKGGCKNDLP